jgi:hypothetical protein
MNTYNGNADTLIPYLSAEDRETVVACKATARAEDLMYCIRLNEDNSLYGTYLLTSDEVDNYYQSGGIWGYSK